jgi:hypothetical protein
LQEKKKVCTFAVPNQKQAFHRPNTRSDFWYPKLKSYRLNAITINPNREERSKVLLKIEIINSAAGLIERSRKSGAGSREMEGERRRLLTLVERPGLGVKARKDQHCQIKKG